MKVQTQLTLSGEEAAEYMEYRTELARLGFTSFDSLKKEQKRLAILHKEVKLVQDIRKAIQARIRYDGAYIIGGRQYHSTKEILEMFKRITYNSLDEYAKGKSLSVSFESELLETFHV